MAVERPLMKCPHCGKLNWACIEYSATGAFQIQCQTCRSAGPIGDSRDNAMELWNWREPQESPSLETFSEPSAADMANAGARKELEGFSDAFAARDELKRSEAEARAKRQG
jgi:hypothetical protein